MADKFRINWITSGGQYGEEKKEFEEQSPGIKVWEITRSVSMDEGDRVYGEPIDAEYAIYFIRNLWTKLQEKKVNRRDKTLQDLEKLYSRVKEILKQTNQSEQIRGEFNGLATNLEKRIKKDQQWLINLLKHSFAITFDKSPLLKTLSQPRCEGIRFYLCLTDHEGYESAEEEEHEEGEKHLGSLSLVTVGVDKNGKDLHYEYAPEKHTYPKIPNIETRSMPCEYPSIMRLHNIKEPDVKELEPYVFYKYAMPKGKKQIDDE